MLANSDSDRLGFYVGMSKYNRSLIGWNGHTEEGGTISTIDGKLKSRKIKIGKKQAFLLDTSSLIIHHFI